MLMNLIKVFSEILYFYELPSYLPGAKELMRAQDQVIINGPFLWWIHLNDRFSAQRDSEVHIIHVIIAYTMESLLSLT